MSKSHTKKQSAPGVDLGSAPGLGLVELAGSGLPEALAGRVSVELELFAARMHEGLLAAAVAVGLEVFDQLLAADVAVVAGVKGRHNPDRMAVRHGTDPAKVPMGGRMVEVRKPRVRTADGTAEVPLETWAAVASRDLLCEHTVAAMLAGVSTRPICVAPAATCPGKDQRRCGGRCSKPPTTPHAPGVPITATTRR